jgi:hypothetical protein
MGRYNHPPSLDHTNNYNGGPPPVDGGVFFPCPINLNMRTTPEGSDDIPVGCGYLQHFPADD